MRRHPPSPRRSLAVAAIVFALVARRFVDRVRRGDRSRRGEVSLALVVMGVVAGSRAAGMARRCRARHRSHRSSGHWEVAVDWAGRRPVHGIRLSRPLGDEGSSRGRAGFGPSCCVVAQLVHRGVARRWLIGLALFVAFVAVVYHRRHARRRWTVAAHALAVRRVRRRARENMTETLVVGNQLTVALLTATAVAATPGARTSDLGVFSPALRSGPAYYRTLEGRTPRRG